MCLFFVSAGSLLVFMGRKASFIRMTVSNAGIFGTVLNLYSKNHEEGVKKKMSSDLLEYVELTQTEISQLDTAQTVFLMSVSPIEVHGYHLPVGTDVFIAEELLGRYAKVLREKHPDLSLVKLPPLYVGSDALPSLGSLSVRATALEKILIDYGKGLAKQGFRYLFIADNHGGPRHQLAIAKASAVLWKKHRFYLIDPFNLVFRRMVQHDEELFERTGLGPSNCGDDPDSHAGTNETSLMLASCPQKVRENYSELDPSLPAEHTGGAKLVLALARSLMKVGAKQAGRDLEHLANTLAWVSSNPMKPYMGDPKLASAKNGEAMLNYRLEEAIKLFDRALQGEPVQIKPMLWNLRVLRFLPE